MTNLQTIPAWAPRVTQGEIQRLYETDAQGIYDEDLINDVGFGLLARCRSFIEANEARAGKARCPRCSTVVTHAGHKEETLHCDCGWELTWGEYFRTIQHVQLSGAEPVLEQFRAFVSTFPTSRTPRDKMIAIDRLIHGFHWYYKNNSPTRPVAVNLIKGRMNEVVEFLDQLAYSDKSTPDAKQNYVQWDENIEVNRNWYRSRRRDDARSEDPPEKK